MFQVQTNLGGHWCGIGALCERRTQAELWILTLVDMAGPEVGVRDFRIVDVDHELPDEGTVPAGERIDLSTGEIIDGPDLS